MKSEHDWYYDFAGGVTVADKDGIIIYMNKQALELFKEDGGETLIGRNVLDCHPEPSRSLLRRLLETQKPNQYTVRKGDELLMIHQLPWFSDGEYGGIIELSIPVPDEIPFKDRY